MACTLADLTPNVTESSLRRAHGVHPINAVQVEYRLFTLDIESPTYNLLKACHELGVAVVAFSPIGHGILTGLFQSHTDLPERDLRRMYPKYAEENFSEILRLVAKLEQVAEEHGNTPAQVALAWLLAKAPGIFPIPGTKSAVRMEENAASALLQLSDQEVQEIRELAEGVEIQGTRYPAA
ncbi:aldo/keto reductase [Penicillium argentinense]|uniref:Aldo/keto reductase n=1 Tax=Penicillium argentinense TaxID=1131581 RepID=A0A9W9FNM0_9EURO|nr:aldo/keto reductase [Penicillium argentinense]KAJ5103581.1 aldo/keto reductase [Penicillium argentinense]